MKLYNRELEEIEDAEIEKRIRGIIDKIPRFLYQHYEIDEKMIESRLNELSVVMYSSENDQTFFKEINGTIHELPISDTAAAFHDQKSQKFNGDTCLLENAVFVDGSNTDEKFEHLLLHEVFHDLSSDAEMIYSNNEGAYKTGVSIGIYDRDDNLLSEDSRGLNEGITELLASKLTRSKRWKL